MNKLESYFMLVIGLYFICLTVVVHPFNMFADFIFRFGGAVIVFLLGFCKGQGDVE